MTLRQKLREVKKRSKPNLRPTRVAQRLSAVHRSQITHGHGGWDPHPGDLRNILCVRTRMSEIRTDGEMEEEAWQCGHVPLGEQSPCLWQLHFPTGIEKRTDYFSQYIKNFYKSIGNKGLVTGG